MWYLVVSRAQRPLDEVQAHHAAHMEWLLGQHRAGRVLFSGATSDRSCGVYVLLADNLQEAEGLAGEDPYNAQGDRVPQVWEWNVQRSMRLDGPTITDIEAMAGHAAKPQA